MTDTATPVTTGGEAQPIADANSIDSIITNAETTAAEEPKPNPPENTEQEDAGKTEDETPWPKKAQNALSRRDKQIGKLRAEREHMAAELEKLRSQPAPKQPQPQTNQPIPEGMPKEADYKSYAEYLEAVNDYKIDQKFSKLQEGQKQTQQATQEKAWEEQRLNIVDKQAEEFAKDFPDVVQIFTDNTELVKSFPPEIKRALLEADNAPLAFYNLAKEDKLADLADMSLVDAKVEIRLAQMKAAEKPRTKAPTPLPASRGSVASTKSLDSMSGDELLKWIKS